jgi:hypothetical protein
VDPFRDELAAAHAKIAELEAQIRELHTKRPARRGNAVLYILLGLTTFFLFVIGAATALALSYR